MKVKIVLCLILFAWANCTFFTQKTIWLYWDGDFTDANMFYKMCYTKIRAIAQNQNWKVILVTRQTLHKYINNYTEFQQTIKKAKLTTIQAIGDYVKLLLVGDNGGVYFDISSVFFDGFDWLLTLEKKPQLITNYVKGVEPEAIMFYTTITQYRTEYFYPGQGLKNYLPGYGLYFLAGKKGSQTLKRIKEAFETLYIKTYEQGLLLMMKDDIFFRNLDHSYYLTIDRAISYAVQQHQQQLDNNLSLFSKRQNANQALKIWGLHSQDSTLAQLFQTWHANQEYSLTINQLRQKGYTIKYYHKYNGGGGIYIPTMKDIGDLFQKYKTLQNYMTTNPSYQACRTKKFIVNDSIIGRLIQQNKQAEKLNIKTITVQQREKWKSYCKKFPEDLNITVIKNKIIEQIIFSYKAYQAQTSVFDRNINKSIKTSEKIFLLIIEYRFMFYLFLLACIVWFFYLGMILSIKKLILYCLKKQNYHRKTQELQINIQYYISFISITLFFPLLIMIYFQVIVSGGVHSQESILGVFLIFVSIRKWVFRIKSQSKILGFTIEQHENLIKSFAYYSLAKTLLYSTENREQLRIPQAVILGLVFPQILKMAQQIILKRKHKNKSALTKMINYVSSYSQLMVFSIICIFILVPNVKFITTNGIYLIRKLFYIICIPFALFYGMIFCQICKLIKDTWGQNNQTAIQLFLSQIIVKFLFMSALILKCFWINQNYIHWMLTQQKVFFDFFMMTVFMIVNLSNCEIFQYSQLMMNRQSNQSYVSESKNLQSRTEYTENMHNKQLSIKDDNKGDKADLSDNQLEKQQQMQVSTIDVAMKVKKLQIFARIILFNLIPFTLIMLRSTYKDEPYKYNDFITVQLLLILLNCGAIMAYKSYLLHCQ